jgi:hypothetical protein
LEKIISPSKTLLFQMVTITPEAPTEGKYSNLLNFLGQFFYEIQVKHLPFCFL